MQTRLRGVVKTAVDVRGFGLIQIEGGGEYFFTWRDVVTPLPRIEGLNRYSIANLHRKSVEFMPVEKADGEKRPRATRVEVLQ